MEDHIKNRYISIEKTKKIFFTAAIPVAVVAAPEYLPAVYL